MRKSHLFVPSKAPINQRKDSIQVLLPEPRSFWWVTYRIEDALFTFSGLWLEGFGLAHSLGHTCLHGMQDMAAAGEGSWLYCIHMEEAGRNGCLCLACFLFIGSGTLDHGTVPLTFRMSLPNPVNLI